MYRQYSYTAVTQIKLEYRRTFYSAYTIVQTQKYNTDTIILSQGFYIDARGISVSDY